jgi:hypothetical protein
MKDTKELTQVLIDILSKDNRIIELDSAIGIITFEYEGESYAISLEKLTGGVNK